MCFRLASGGASPIFGGRHPPTKTLIFSGNRRSRVGTIGAILKVSMHRTGFFFVLPALLLVACGSSHDGATPDQDAGGDTSSGDANDETSKSDAPTDGKTDSNPKGDTSPTDAPAPTGLHVEGTKLVDSGKTVRLLGVNHSSGEYACVGGYGIIPEAPDASAMADAILTWKANAVRIPVNEQCWLGINGIDAADSGDPYRKAVTDYVKKLRAKGLYVIFDLHWAAPSTSVPKGQLPMADADHAIDFWKSAAANFKDDLGVVFDVFNEPFIDKSNAATTDPWACLQHGCTIHGGSAGGSSYSDYKSAGTQDLLDAIRSTGATNVVMIPGLAWTNDLTGWLTHKPTDPTGNLVASLHLYNFNACKDSGCWASQYEPISKTLPVITGELGEDDCGKGFIDTYMPWADARGISYLGWTWNTWSCTGGPALLSAYDGTATAFGAGLRDHLKSL